MLLGKLICRWKGRRCSRATVEPTWIKGATEPHHTMRVRHCLRCDPEREVKTRKAPA